MSGAGFFAMYNRHKASVCLDLKSPEGLAQAKELVATADILIENFRPGALDRLGLGYEALSVDNPRLIHCSLKGFLDGPYQDRTALDEVAQMMGGLAYMTGPPGRPLRAGTSVIDVTGGMFGIIAVLAAVEERHRTGRGGKVQASLFETTVYLVGQHMAQLAVTGKAAAPMPARISAWGIYDVFETADEPLFVGVVTDSLWAKFCDLFAGMARAEIVAKLDGTGMPHAPIGRPEDMFDDPHLLASGGLEPVTLSDGRETVLPALPVALDGVRPGGAFALPEAGAQQSLLNRTLSKD